MSKHITIFVTLVLLTVCSLMADQKDDFLIGDASSVKEAVEHIRATLEFQGFEILATIDHAAAADSVDLKLRPTTLVLASYPFFELSLIRRRKSAAIDFPFFKFLVFQDENGQIQLEFNDEGGLVDRHRIPQRDRKLRVFDIILNQFGRLENGIVKVDSEQTVEKTTESLLKDLREREFRIPIPEGIDLQELAKKFGARMRPTRLIIFGNPRAGTPLMQNDQSIGLDLPQKFLISEDKSGQVFILFNDPKLLARKHNLQQNADPGPISLSERLDNMFNGLKGLAEAGANPRSE